MNDESLALNSAPAVVDLADGRAVLKWVRDAGEPRTTTTGELIHLTEDGAVALLDFVAGDPLDPDDLRDQQDMALTLAAVHATGHTLTSGAFMSDLIADNARDVQPWAQPSLHLVLAEYGELPDLTWVAQR